MRLTRKKGETIGAETALLLRPKLAAGFTLQIGDADAPVHQRVYRKTTDGGGVVVLPAAKHRARREVTLKAEALAASNKAFPSLELAESSGWKFEALAVWFNFRKPREDLLLTSMQALVLERQVVLGVRSSARPGRRLYNARVQADTALNELSRNALRELSKRFKKRDDRAATEAV